MSNAAAGLVVRGCGSAGAWAALAAAALGLVVLVPFVPLAPTVRLGPEQAAAIRGGRPVEVLAQRTPWSQTFALPSGRLELRESPVPVRARRADGSWAAVDTTLRRRADGSVAPEATVAGLVLSGGGDGPLARIAAGGHTFGLGWAGRLPAPVLSGDTATYPGVLADVDLRVTAQTTGFSEVLVVKTRAAAANPALRAIRFPVSAGGLTLHPDGVVDRSGRQVFAIPTPQMWDSGGGRRVDMAVSAAEGALTVTPDPALLADPDTRFPVSIDPDVTWSGSMQAWTSEFDGSPTTSYFNGTNLGCTGDPASQEYKFCQSSGKMRSGWEDGAGGIAGTWRSFLRMDTRQVEGATISNATLRVMERFSSSAGCAPVPVQVWWAGSISSATTWNKDPGWLQKLQTVSAAHGAETCTAGYVNFTVTSLVQEKANANIPDLTFGIRAQDEGSSHAEQYKKFDDGTTPNTRTPPVLDLTYDHAPNAAASLAAAPGNPLVGTSQVPCSATPQYVSSLTPTLLATVTDKDGPAGQQAVRADFHQLDAAGNDLGLLGTDPSSGYGAQGAHQLTLAPGVLADGQTLYWTAWAEDDAGVVTRTAPTCALTVDVTRPDQVPSVQPAATPTGGAPVYQAGRYGGAVGTPGWFTLGPAGVGDVAGYLYSVEGGAQHYVAASSVTVQVTPLQKDLQRLTVQSVDRAGNESDPATYSFLVNVPAGPVATWNLDETSGTTASDATGHLHGATLVGGASWTGAGHTGGALQLDGISGWAETADPVLRTDQGFTVDAWVNLAVLPTADATVVAQDGTARSGFNLMYQQSANAWAFAVAAADTPTAPALSAAATSPPAVGAWTHLVGVFDADRHQLRLYVDPETNPAPAAVLGNVNPSWTASGPVTIGSRAAEQAGDSFLPGSIDDVSIFWGPVDPPGSPAPAGGTTR